MVTPGAGRPLRPPLATPLSLYETNIFFYHNQILSLSGTKKFIKSVITKWIMEDVILPKIFT